MAIRFLIFNHIFASPQREINTNGNHKQRWHTIEEQNRVDKCCFFSRKLCGPLLFWERARRSKFMLASQKYDQPSPTRVLNLKNVNKATSEKNGLSPWEGFQSTFFFIEFGFRSWRLKKFPIFDWKKRSGKFKSPRKSPQATEFMYNWVPHFSKGAALFCQKKLYRKSPS